MYLQDSVFSVHCWLWSVQCWEFNWQYALIFIMPAKRPTLQYCQFLISLDWIRQVGMRTLFWNININVVYCIFLILLLNKRKVQMITQRSTFSKTFICMASLLLSGKKKCDNRMTFYGSRGANNKSFLELYMFKAFEFMITKTVNQICPTIWIVKQISNLVLATSSNKHS